MTTQRIGVSATEQQRPCAHLRHIPRHEPVVAGAWGGAEEAEAGLGAAHPRRAVPLHAGLPDLGEEGGKLSCGARNISYDLTKQE